MKSINTLLSQPGIANENDKVEDLLHYDDKVTSLHQVVENTPQKAMIGIIGTYGQGKSVMLNKYRGVYIKKDEKKNDEDEDYKAVWIEFEAWKYFDKSELWDGFVLDFVKQYEPYAFQGTLNKLDGVTPTGAKAAGTLLNLIPTYGKTAAELYKVLTEQSPAKRTFQIQDLFKAMLKPGRKIYIVIEDADRSGNAGIHFIETLSNFLRNLEVDVEIKAFVLASNKSLLKATNRDAFEKALDITERFIINSRDMHEFVNALVSPIILDDKHYEDWIVELLQHMLYDFELSIRQLKLIVRQAAVEFRRHLSNGHHPDPLIVMVLEALKHIEGKTNSKDGTAFGDIAQDTNHLSRGGVFYTLIIALAQRATYNDAIQLLNSLPPIPFTASIAFVDTGKYLADLSSLALPAYEFLADRPKEVASRFELPDYYLSQ